MGGLLPGAAMSALQIGMEAAQRGAQQQQAKAEAAAQAQQITTTQAISARERQDQLRRALATQRARFGAQGLLSTSGSARAVISGLEEDAERDDADSRLLTDLRLDRLNDQVDWQRRRSLLDASMPAYRSAFTMLQRGVRSVPLIEE